MSDDVINVLIPNATGPSNVGDEAILFPLLKILLDSAPNIEITVLTSNPELCKNDDRIFFDENLYGWSMSDSLSFRTKFVRSFQVFVAYLLLKMDLEVLIGNKELLKIINYYKNADLIVYVGGGSLRTTSGFKNSCILLVNLMIYVYANFFKTKRILTPISFGPFYYNWQYLLTAKIIEKSDIISLREIYSENFFKKYSDSATLKSSDFALFLEKRNSRKNKNDFVVGFTITNGLGKKYQKSLEEAYAFALYKLSRKLTIKILPIIQVHSLNTRAHNDLIATRKVIKGLKKYGLKADPPIFIKNLNSAIKTYGKLNLLLGMRMHSNIIAATQGVPFAAVAYEHKTTGIAKELGVEECSIRVEDVNEQKLSEVLIKTFNNKDEITNTVADSLKRINTTENIKWSRIFRSFLTYKQIS